MQSKNYVPDVSGWKLHKDGRLEIDGVTRVSGLTGATEPAPPPFVIVDGVTYFSQAAIDEAALKAKTSSDWRVTLQVNSQGQYAAAGIGIGLDPHLFVSAEKFKTTPVSEFDAAMAKGAGAVLDLVSSRIRDSELGASLKAGTADHIGSQVRAVLRAELRPGGLLYRTHHDRI